MNNRYLFSKALTACVALLGLIHGHVVAANRERPPDVSKAVTYAPTPEYTYEARLRSLTGEGVVVVYVDDAGLVTDAIMAISTGHKLLDDAALSAFRRWRFKPGTLTAAKIPVVFTMGGGVVGKLHIITNSRPMDQLLVPFLGKGAVLNAPIPRYPMFPPWGNKQGTGVYELHFGADGKVTEIKILTTSGDATFDRAAVETLREWRLRKGPKIVELPLAFSLAPGKYRVRIP